MTRLHVIDAFTDQPFTGNPAAVCVLEQPAETDWMQQVAAEMNLSETAFLLPQGEDWNLRWFTPVCEVDLCGHATLASTFLLHQLGIAGEGTDIRFHTRSGVLTCSSTGKWIEMDFPATPARPCTPPADLSSILGASPEWIGRNQDDLLVELGDESTVRGLRPDLTQLSRIEVRGVIVTAPSTDPGCDFVSRFFAPQSGIPEDPVTGSAHATLGPFWGERLGSECLTGRQVSQRGGTVKIVLRGDRVTLAGQAVLISEVRLRV